MKGKVLLVDSAVAGMVGTVIENFVNITHLGENLTILQHLFHIFLFRFGGLILIWICQKYSR